MSAEPAAAARLNAAELWRAAALALGLKALLLLLDPQLRLLLPDSAIYLQAAIDGRPPLDRSFAYPWLVRITALASGDALALILLQSACGVFAAVCLYGWLRSQSVRSWLALAATAAFALEPAQLYYERNLMAEASGGALLVAFFVALSVYLARGHARWIPCYVLLGLGAVAMRLSLLPVVLGLGVLAPVLRFLASPSRDRGALWRQTAHLALAVLATWASHAVYQQAYGLLTHGPPAYNAAAGRIRLGVVAPLVRPAHFAGSGVDPSALQQLRIALDDPRQREAHIWLPGGLVDVVTRHAAEPEAAARRISANALRDRPWALLPVAGSLLQEHLDPRRMAEHLAVDLGPRPPHETLARQLHQRLQVDPATLRDRSGLATRWFALGSVWLTGCLFALVPLALAALWRGRALPWPALRLLLCFAALGLTAGYLLFAPVASFRYLHPLPWFVLASLALLAESMRRSQPGGGADARNTQKRELR
jgi:hypothetical protein